MSVVDGSELNRVVRKAVESSYTTAYRHISDLNTRVRSLERAEYAFLVAIESSAQLPALHNGALAFVLGEGRMLADFETGVRGAATGEKRSFPVAFPEDYTAKELAGKTAQFEVTVKKVEAPNLPALDAEFARQLGVADGSLETLRADVRKNLERELSQRLRGRVKSAVMEALPALSTIELPKALVQAESEQLAERAKADFKQRGMDVKDLPIPAEAFADTASKRVRLGLIVGEIVKTKGLAAKPDQLRKQIEEFAQSYENPGEVIRWYFSDRERLAEVEALVVEQNVVDWVLANAKVTDTPIGFDELMAANG